MYERTHLPLGTLVEELRVGSFEGTGLDPLANLKGLVALNGGGFAVLDAQVQELRVFTPMALTSRPMAARGRAPESSWTRTV